MWAIKIPVYKMQIAPENNKRAIRKGLGVKQKGIIDVYKISNGARPKAPDASTYCKV